MRYLSRYIFILFIRGSVWMDQEMNYGSDYKYIPTTSVNSGLGIEVLPDIYCQTIQIVNVVYVGKRLRMILY